MLSFRRFGFGRRFTKEQSCTSLAIFSNSPRNFSGIAQDFTMAAPKLTADSPLCGLPYNLGPRNRRNPTRPFAVSEPPFNERARLRLLFSDDPAV
jgi:hypothetical protein